MGEHNHKECCSCGCSCGHSDSHKEENGGWIRLFVAAALFVCGIIVSFFEAAVLPVIIFLAAYITAGYEVLLGAFRKITCGEVFGEEFLMTVASLGAFAIGEYAEACAVMLLFELGERIQDRAADKSRESIREMLELRVENIYVLHDGDVVKTDPAKIKVGDVLVVRAGEKVACDGVVESGTGDMDMSLLTGESCPVSKEADDSVLAGSISIDTTFYIRVTEEYDKSTVAKILETLEHARKNKSRTENFIHRFARIYTPSVCAFALCVMLLPPLFGLGAFSTWIYRGLCALAASCPCALVISVPLGFFAGLGASSKIGVLVKGGNYLEALSKIEGVVFDKTGTVTSGSFVYTGEENAASPAELHFAAAVCERFSTHPLALAINEKFGHMCEGVEITNSSVVSGRGVKATVGEDVYLCGNSAFMAEQGVEYTAAKGAGTSVYAAKNGVFLGSILLTDAVKPDSKKAIAHLASLGVTDTVMLTGDRRDIAEAVAKEVVIKKVYADLLPTDKAEIFSKARENARSLCYVGDGINDAPVLALADVGVAMGGIGSAAALEAADAVILGDSLEKLPEVIALSRYTVKIVRQNIVFSLAVKLAIILLATLGIANMWLAVFGDVGVCVIAVLNTLRIMKKNRAA